MLERENIEDALRSLPRPRVPSGLAARLLADAPVAAKKSRHAIGWWMAGVSAVAASIVIAVLVVPRMTERDEGPGAGEADLLARVGAYDAIAMKSPELLLKDTDPCRILPNFCD